jgi:hypothetical protein
MTLRDFFQMMLRWWKVAACALLLALVAGAAAFVATPSTYSLTGSYLLLSPAIDNEGRKGNPYLELGNGVALATDILQVALTDGETLNGILASRPEMKVTIERNNAVAAAVLVVTVQDTELRTPGIALDRIADEARTHLQEIQSRAGAPQRSWVTINELTKDPKPDIGYTEPVRNAVLAGGGVGALAVLLIAIMERRRLQSKSGTNGTDRHPSGAVAHHGDMAAAGLTDDGAAKRRSPDGPR